MTTTTETAATPLSPLPAETCGGYRNALPEFRADGSVPSPADRANLLASLGDGTLRLPDDDDFGVWWVGEDGGALVALIQPAWREDGIELVGSVHERGPDGTWGGWVRDIRIDGRYARVPSWVDWEDEDVEILLGWLVQHAVSVREDLARAREAGCIVEQRTGQMVGYPGGAVMLRALPWTHVADEPATDAEVERVIRALKRGAMYLPRQDFCLTWGDAYGEANCAEVLVTPRNYYGVTLNIIHHHRYAVDDWRCAAGGDDYDAGGWIYGPVGGDYAVRVVLGHLARLARVSRRKAA